MSLAAQCTVMSSRDAIAQFGRGHVRWMVERGRWQRPYKGVIVLHPAQLTHDERLWCALIAHGPEATTAGLTAAELDGLRGFSTPTQHLLVPRGRNPRAMPGVKVHSSERLSERDIHPVRLPRRTRIQRSIIDAATWAVTPLQTQGILAASVQQKLVTPEALQLAIAPRLTLPRRGLIVETLRDVAGGSLSEYEVLFVRMCRENRLPMPTRQVRRRDSSGRMRYLDAVFDDYDLVAEIDGQQHMDVLAWWEDMDRNNAVVVDDGKSLLRFAGFALRHQRNRVASVLQRYFEQHGRR